MVSGGVTGTRTAWLKHGEWDRIWEGTEDEARSRAVKLNANVSLHRTCEFNYEAKERI